VSTPDTDSSAAKAAARAEARARRRSTERPDPAALARVALALLEELPGPRRVTCYASYGTEPDTGTMGRLRGAATASGRR
jgi:5-formyltetrahydrofolate cyclo-ligase